MDTITKYSEIEKIPCSVKYIHDGLCSVTFTLPECQINSFVLMLSSLSTLFRGLGWKAKTNIDAIHERNMQNQEAKDLLIKEFENATVEEFNTNLESALTPSIDLTPLLQPVLA